jgi:hypothetical protein
MSILKISKTLIFELSIYSIFYVFVLLYYPTVNNVVNYMWNLNLSFSNNYALLNFIFYITLIILIKNKEVHLKHFYQILILGLYLPVLAISSNTSSGLFYCFLIFICIIEILIFQNFFSSFDYKNKTIKNFDKSFFIKVSKILIIFTSILLIFLFGSKFQTSMLYTLTNVYEIREDVRVSGISSYLLSWIPAILLPIGISIYLNNKKVMYLILTSIISFLIFQAFAMKVHFLTLILLLLFGLLYVKSKYLKRHSVIIFFSFTFIFIIVLKTLLNDDFVLGFLDRFFYLPGMLNHWYFDFFSENPYNYFNGSRIGILFGIENYKIPLGFIIDGANGGAGMNANTGIFASVFAEIGYIGLFFFSFIVGISVSILDRLHQKFNIFGYLILINISFILINTPLNDAFLTHGLLILVMLGIFLKKNNLKIN